jgi:hypothetical protein
MLKKVFGWEILILHSSIPDGDANLPAGSLVQIQSPVRGLKEQS